MKNLSLSRGSEWRQWDLHFHTPSSYDYQNKNTTNEEMINGLKHENISLVAITDHHVIDVEKILALQKLGKEEGITVLPGIELRTDKGGSESVHIVGIFPEDKPLSLKTIWTKIQGKLDLTDDTLKEMGGNEGISSKLEEATKVIHDCGGLVSIHVASKSNSLENITNAIPAQMAIKHQILKHIDIFEVGKKTDIEDYLTNVYPNIKKQPPMIICSDSHSIKKYSFKEKLWIKADLSFKGLKQIVNEPFGRVYVGDFPPKLSSVRDNPSRYIKFVEIKHKQGSKRGWFDSKIPINSGLVAVIGNKGSGKSALTDSIGLAGSSHIDTRNYSFLNNDKFLKRPEAEDYKVTIAWCDGIADGPFLLSNSVDLGKTEKVKYLPQSFVEEICNANGVTEKFQGEINKVIFSYIPKETRGEAASLDQLIHSTTKEAKRKMQIIRSQMSNVNTNMCKLEEKKDPTYKARLEDEFQQISRKIESLKKQEPKKIPKPKTAFDKKQQEQLEKFQSELDTVDFKIDKAREELEGVRSKLKSVSNIKKRLTTLQESVDEFKDEYQKDLENLEIDIDKLLVFKFKNELLIKKEEGLKKKKSKLVEKLSKSTEKKQGNTLIDKKDGLELKLKKLVGSLDTKQKAYESYKEKLKTHRKSLGILVGEKNDTNLETLNGVENELEYIKNTVDVDIKNLISGRKSLTIELYEELSGQITFYEDIYAPVIEFVKLEKTKQEKVDSVLSFNVEVVFNKTDFLNTFLSHIDKTRTGYFKGIVESEDKLAKFLSKSSFGNKGGMLDFLKDIAALLFVDEEGEENISYFENQLLNGKKNKKPFYDFLFHLKYLDVRYNITFNGKNLNDNEFSPGEMGTLLLIFYLLVDKSELPLVIDQPEENLDNESVVKLLVPYIKKAKEKRQIILVTHNPNLAVVCDAEQIIRAFMNKKNNKIRYISGSMESEELNTNVVNILEGTLPAFDNRRQKYWENEGLD